MIERKDILYKKHSIILIFNLTKNVKNDRNYADYIDKTPKSFSEGTHKSFSLVEERSFEEKNVCTAYIKSRERFMEKDLVIINAMLKRKMSTEFKTHHFWNANLLVIHFLGTEASLPEPVSKFFRKSNFVIRIRKSANK